MNFGKLQLSEELKHSLALSVDSGSLSHAVLLTGGTEKQRKELAVLLAQALMCESENNRPCLKCNACKKVKNGIHPDITVISGEAGKQRSIKIDAIREIRSKAFILPNEAEYQIFIILEASGMGEEAQNALLKILEEPPATARFIFASRSRDDFRQTVLSRVTAFAISENSGLAAGEKESPKAANAANGILNALLSRNEYMLVLSTGAIEKDKKAFKASCEKMLLILRDALYASYGTSEFDINSLEYKLAKEFSVRKILSLYEAVKQLMADADKNANDNLLLTRLSISLMSCTESKET